MNNLPDWQGMGQWKNSNWSDKKFARLVSIKLKEKKTE
jgi:hypothetical protein